jgi:hypothetical protein
MVAFGVLVLSTLKAPASDRTVWLQSVIIGGAYVAFGALGMIAIRPDPTFMLFLVPAVSCLPAPFCARPGVHRPTMSLP